MEKVIIVSDSDNVKVSRRVADLLNKGYKINSFSTNIKEINSENMMFFNFVLIKPKICCCCEVEYVEGFLRDDKFCIDCFNGAKW